MRICLDNGVYRNLSYPNDNVPPPTFAPPSPLDTNCMRLLSWPRRGNGDCKGKLCATNGTISNLLWDNQRVRELEGSSTYSAGQGPWQTSEEAGPSEFNDEDNWVDPEYYNGRRWTRDYYEGGGGSIYYDNQGELGC